MLDAPAIALAVADTLEAWAAPTGDRITDEAVGLFLWHRVGIRDEDDLAALINRVRAIINGRAPPPRPANDPAPPRKARRSRAPVQLSLAFGGA